MDKFGETIETAEKQEAHEIHEAPKSVEKSAEEIGEQMIKQSENEVANFQLEGESEFARLENRAEKDEAVIEGEDKKSLGEINAESNAAKEELTAKISGETKAEEIEFIKDIESQVEKANIVGVVKDKNFEGSVIVKTQDADGRVAGYALRKNSNGELEGNKIGYMEDGSVGAVYQLHESDFAKLGENGVLEKYAKGELNEKDAKFARTEIQEVVELEDLEKKAAHFIETFDGGNISIEDAEKYENEYAIPAYQKAKRVKGVIENNNNERVDSGFEKEKTFNAISSIIKDKEALCIHFLTGFSNANNSTSASGIESSSGDTFAKRSKEAIKQLKTLAGLSPSISTSVFADSHNFDSTWYRESGQPVGVILREGECTEISLDDAGTMSSSPKNRRGHGEIITEAGLERVLSSDEGKFTQSSYNEFVVAEPKIGALFITTNKPIEKGCLEGILQENDKFGYPLLFERNGKFYQVPREDLEKLLQEGELEDNVNISDSLIDSREVSREAIRTSILTMEDAELKENEKQRFDEYVENYDLKPHFEWADELKASIKTRSAYVLDKEIKKNSDREKVQVEELETEGQLTRRLVEYFNKNSHLGKSWTENKEETIVYDANGKIFEGFPPPEGFTMETKRSVTEFWEYTETVMEPSAAVDDVVGFGEVSNFNTETRRKLFVIKQPSGKIVQQSSERIAIISKTTDGNGAEYVQNAHSSLVGEKMETINNETVRTNSAHELEVRDALKPLYLAIDYGENGLIINQEELVSRIRNGRYRNEKTPSEAIAYAFTMAEMCEKDNDLIEAEKWKNTAVTMSGDIERYEFVKSKLNKNGTLKLDNDDVKQL